MKALALIVTRSFQSLTATGLPKTEKPTGGLTCGLVSENFSSGNDRKLQIPKSQRKGYIDMCVRERENLKLLRVETWKVSL